MKTPPGEAYIRFVRILTGLSLTWFTRYCFSEESIFPLAKPFPTLRLDSYFICTRLTEAFSTCVTTSSYACSYFVFPFISYQIWCFLIPSCYVDQRARYNICFYLSGICFFLFLFLSISWVVPYLWHFLCFAGTTSTSILMIKLQPSISDYILNTNRILFISSICSQVPVIVINMLDTYTVMKVTKNRRYMLVSSLVIAAYGAPPDIWCVFAACLPITLMMELTIMVALIVRVREEGRSPDLDGRIVVLPEGRQAASGANYR
uniref:Sec-independent protein translocase protein n=1 Tax=Welwitschia mirabilis TaxID=3377 RepID=A0A8H2SEZ8_WELMI|nr:Sec-independent protein translocase protein [Welwitschia mirabilis]